MGPAHVKWLEERKASVEGYVHAPTRSPLKSPEVTDITCNSSSFDESSAGKDFPNLEDDPALQGDGNEGFQSENATRTDSMVSSPVIVANDTDTAATSNRARENGREGEEASAINKENIPKPQSNVSSTCAFVTVYLCLILLHDILFVLHPS